MGRLVRWVAGIVLVLFLVLPITADQRPATMVLSPYPPPSGELDVNCGGEGAQARSLRRPRPHRIGSRCTMAQRPLYAPWLPGTYYFRPYHHSHIHIHQMYGELWGEDSATPYANRLFQRVYQEYRQSEGF